jgi:hypothetical protein
MRFCINFFGELKPPARSHYLFHWCAAFAEFPSDEICKVWVDCDFYIGYGGFDTLTELMLLGLKLSRTLSLSPSNSCSSAYRLEDLMQIYRTKEEVLTYYEHFVTQVLQSGDDLPTNECDPEFSIRWTCCPKHRYMFIQRLMLNDWLHHIFDTIRFDEEEEHEALPERDYLVDYPSTEEMKQRLSNLLVQTFSPQEWLRARFAYGVQAEHEHWELPIKDTCQRKHHGSLLCCQFHTTMNIIWFLFSAWLEHFNDIYHISSWVDEQGHVPGLSSVNGVALFIHLANIDTSGITFTNWFKDVLSVDIKKFHLR